jgi:hypothetical protein
MRFTTCPEIIGSFGTVAFTQESSVAMDRTLCRGLIDAAACVSIVICTRSRPSDLHYYKNCGIASAIIHKQFVLGPARASVSPASE